jgi:hypothetical protein
VALLERGKELGCISQRVVCNRQGDLRQGKTSRSADRSGP